MPAAERTAPRVGVIMLNTAFPRPPGDIGNPETFAGTALYEVVEAATVARLQAGDGTDLLDGFLAARDRLVARGAGIVTTSCGILVLHQAALAQGCPVPVLTSALLAIPRIEAETGARVGVLAMDARSITPAHLAAAGARPDTPVAGLESGRELYPTLRRNDARDQLDPARARADVIAAGRDLLRIAPDIGAIVVECTNLPPYSDALARATGLPVHDILTLLPGRT
ncbi:aspartate/glutamate racemase family protein [uncultured Paracoccus sp.]|uniref:aspartate/glutamate racemase family protein n=1 Tax=uncultured Paracoccus sp. TaxID=189685 RepID=UPI0025EE9A33|nr:aspartate/glutamate racemase family protein [uncultured Paracoccus sp.]